MPAVKTAIGVADTQSVLLLAAIEATITLTCVNMQLAVPFPISLPTVFLSSLPDDTSQTGDAASRVFFLNGMGWRTHRAPWSRFRGVDDGGRKFG